MSFIPIIHTNAGNILTHNCFLLSEIFNIKIDMKIIKPINLKEKIYKKNPQIFP